VTQEKPKMGALDDLVLIHGWGYSSRVWRDFIPYIEDRWCVSEVDLPGYDVPLKTEPTDIDQVIELISLSIPEKAIVVAWSLGGLIATRLACFRKDIRALVLVASSPCFLNKSDWQHGIEPADFEQLADLLGEDKEKALQEFACLVAIGDKSPRQIIKKLDECSEGYVPGCKTLKAGFVLLEQEDLRRSLINLSCPTLMIFGEKDVLVKSSTATAVKILHTDIYTIEITGSGHAPFLSHPQETALALSKFAGKFL